MVCKVLDVNFVGDSEEGDTHSEVARLACVLEVRRTAGKGCVLAGRAEHERAQRKTAREGDGRIISTMATKEGQTGN